MSRDQLVIVIVPCRVVFYYGCNAFTPIQSIRLTEIIWISVELRHQYGIFVSDVSRVGGGGVGRNEWVKTRRLHEKRVCNEEVHRNENVVFGLHQIFFNLPGLGKKSSK